MTRILAILLALSLTGCAAMSGSNVGAAVLKNLEGCERHYDGTISAGMGAAFSGSVKIDCAPVTPPPAP